MLKVSFPVFLITISCFMNACAQEPKAALQNDQKGEKEVKETVSEDTDPYSEPHQFGGWYCPDNFGFEPVNIKNLAAVPAINGRMPQKWEVQSGAALMYLDPAKFPEAKPLDIKLPALAMVNALYNSNKELAIIIQAFVADEDTIVGYRFPNGGNGSDWYGKVELLSDDQVSPLEGTPFVYEEATIKATKSEIWKAFTKTTFAKKLGKQFNEKQLYKSDWSDNFNVNLEYAEENESAVGYVASMWGNMYMHIDYRIDGRHCSYKMLVMENRETGEATVKFVASSFPGDIEEQQARWADWMKKLKDSSEC